MKWFRAVLTFRCDSKERADAIEKKIVDAAGEEKAENFQIQVREEVHGDIVRPRTADPNDELPAVMDYDEIFEPSPEVL